MRPNLDALVAALIAAGLGAALLMFVVALAGGPAAPLRVPGRFAETARRLTRPAAAGRVGAAVPVAVLTLVITHWLVAALGLAALVAGWPVMFGGQRLERQQILAVEALVMWTESLRDTVTARASLEQAIPATASTAPPPIRPALIRLTGLIRSRVPLDRALLALSADLRDASADKVIGALILNTRQRGSGLARVLSSLASAAREELDQRRRVSAGRATMRRSVQIVVVITLVFAVFLVTFSQAYVKPYASLGGQFVLAMVLCLFAMGFAWMRRLAGGEPATPFLASDASVVESDLRVVAHLTGLSEAEAQELTSNRSSQAGVQP